MTKPLCKFCLEEAGAQSKHAVCRKCTWRVICTPERNKKVSESLLKRYDSLTSLVGYASLHRWVKRRLPVPTSCPSCGEVPRHFKNRKTGFDLANKGEYSRDLSNWEYLCRKCHMVKDGRMFNRRVGAGGGTFKGKRLSQRTLYDNKVGSYDRQPLF